MPAGCTSLNDAQIWLLKTGGFWKKNSNYGHYRTLVIRQGIEHSIDKVQVQITQSNDNTNSRKIIKCVNLNTPGLKGYVRDIHLHVINNKDLVLGLDIEMKAMEGITLREVYIISVNGKIRNLSIAKYTDILSLIDDKK